MAKTVLVVEDRENWRMSFAELLQDLGYNVLQAKCGREFRELAGKADVIVLDISMPAEHGGAESKTAALEALLDLQSDNPSYAVQHPIVRSMWDRTDFKGTPLDSARVDQGCWVSRNEPTASLLELISEIAAGSKACER